MIRRKNQREDTAEVDEGPKGFDDYDLRLGDQMRGERATLGKSLLDVQRELRIRASYIAAIENSDPSVFETPGFIAGYVRSYARYLGMNPDQAFEVFCQESGFATAHGMSAEASTIQKSSSMFAQPATESDAGGMMAMPFTPARESILSRIEPQALGSSVVLVALIAALGYGGWAVLNEIQRVKLAPVEQTPVVLYDLDPVNAAQTTEVETPAAQDVASVFTPPSDTLDRLYRPQALDVPVMVARDAPISTLDPASVGVFTPDLPVMVSHEAPQEQRSIPQVVEPAAPDVVLMAVRPAWVRVSAADKSVLFEKILNAGEEYVVPQTELAPLLRAGMGGSVYVKVNGVLHGPLGEGTGTLRNVELSVASLEEQYEPADMTADPALQEVISLAEARTSAGPAEE
ncbi:helix-turn-helix domain-containing protein [Shimia thalassica]|uniref:helix-turn-helix domain-containing protein n=1 Tax=Shimia thalassica TaxID=1715693 RepID=UPI002494C6CC|nr:helix-turn-helix domain-containing protein [Shimia thalassica]